MARLQLLDGKITLVECDDGLSPVSTGTGAVKLTTVSVSQLNEFGRCRRRWFLRKVRRVEVPESGKARATGVEAHGGIEHVYTKGFLPDGHPQYRRVLAAVANLPLPPGANGIQIERRFSLPLLPSLRFTGIIDWVYVSKVGDPALVVDHKTTGNLAKRIAEPVDLFNDPQMLTYAEAVYQEDAPPLVKVAHNVISTTHVARVLPLEWVDIPRDRAAENWAAQSTTAQAMIDVAAAPPSDWNDVAFNKDACRDFGGCDFLAICALKTPTIGVPGMDADNAAASELLARLKLCLVAPAPTQEAPAAPAATLDTLENVDTTASEPVLLPPDAPPRQTPLAVADIETIDNVNAEGIDTRPGKAKAKRSKAGGVEVYEKEYLATLDIEYLNARAKDGWRLIGFYEGNTAVFSRTH